MKVKRFLTLLALCAPLFLNSCSDENNETTVSINGNSSITINREEADYSFPVTANGKWTANVAGKDATWITLLTAQGNGNGNVEYFVEPNTGDEMRQADIVITAGNTSIIYKITQTIASEADDMIGDNDDATINYSMFGSTVPVGYGMRIKNKTGMSRLNAAQIFSIKNLEDNNIPQLKDNEYVTKSILPTTDIELNTGRDLSSKEQNIGANLSVNVQYGLFKLGLKGAFNMNGSSSGTTFNYTATTTVPVEEISLDYLSLFSDCEEIEDTKNLYRVFSKTFLTIRDSIETLVKNNADETLISQQLKKLDSTFGPVFCAGATLGGNANLSIIMAKTEQTDTLKISGTLSVGFTSLFSINAEASADYLNTNRSQLENSTIKVNLIGGTSNARNTLISSFASITDPNTPTATVQENMLSAISAWAESINSEQGSTYTCTNYELIGIWELFTNDDAIETVKEYFKQQYPNNADGNSPYLVNIENMVNE